MSTSNTTLVRRVVVDDDDPQILYEGPWTVVKNDFRLDDPTHPVYKGSQHRLLNGTGSVTFRFNGTSRFNLYGTSLPQKEPSSVVLDPVVTCTIDGSNAQITHDPSSFFSNGDLLCGGDSTVGPGEHVMQANITSSSSAFYVDYLDFISDAAFPPSESPTVNIDFKDVAVEYLNGAWVFTLRGMKTEQKNAKMRVSFTGSSATFVGQVPRDHPRDNSTGTYILDGGSPKEFTVPGLPINLLSIDNLPLFQLSDLAPGVHELDITYYGPSAPLVFSYLQVEGGDIIQTLLKRDPVARKPPVGRIAGGIVGGVALILALVALILLWKKKRMKQMAKAADAVDLSMPPPTMNRPFAAYEVAPLVFPAAEHISSPDMFKAGVANSTAGPNHQVSLFEGEPSFNPSQQPPPAYDASPWSRRS